MIFSKVEINQDRYIDSRKVKASQQELRNWSEVDGGWWWWWRWWVWIWVCWLEVGQEPSQDIYLTSWPSLCLSLSWLWRDVGFDGNGSWRLPHRLIIHFTKPDLKLNSLILRNLCLSPLHKLQLTHSISLFMIQQRPRDGVVKLKRNISDIYLVSTFNSQRLSKTDFELDFRLFSWSFYQSTGPLCLSKFDSYQVCTWCHSLFIRTASERDYIEYELHFLNLNPMVVAFLVAVCARFNSKSWTDTSRFSASITHCFVSFTAAALVLSTRSDTLVERIGLVINSPQTNSTEKD